ncbi:unnamed protein product [Clonostachys rosea f. rosea IK726]|uniref:Uncharacterized protein n=1 Tax=Clonostachys rosea f. rosea IK726 TaxID=1349383 RepID=A0ACA9UI19_BIOOC|nr:unnamed protein product [Clonostachys rosea f. rosea IK726]
MTTPAMPAFAAAKGGTSTDSSANNSCGVSRRAIKLPAAATEAHKQADDTKGSQIGYSYVSIDDRL